MTPPGVSALSPIAGSWWWSLDTPRPWTRPGRCLDRSDRPDHLHLLATVEQVHGPTTHLIAQGRARRDGQAGGVSCRGGA
jgi:hypothetical protein